MTGFYHTTIECDCEFIIDIGGSIAGESKNNTYNLLLPGERLVLSILPVSSGDKGAYLPVYCILDLSGHANITRCDEHIKLYVMDKNSLHIRVKFPQLSSHSKLPHVMARTDFSVNGRGMRGVVYYNAGSVCVVEDMQANILFALPILCPKGECSIKSRPAPGCTLIFVEVAQKVGVALYVISVSSKIDLFIRCECSSYTVGDFLITKTQLGGAEMTCKYSLEKAGKPEAECAYPKGFAPENALLCFAEMLEFANEKSVMDALHPSLRRDVSYGELIEYMGGYKEVFHPLCDKKHLSLAYAKGNIMEVRTFAVEFSHNKISDISE